MINQNDLNAFAKLINELIINSWRKKILSQNEILESEHSDEGTVILLHGEWGSGKTYFLNNYYMKSSQLERQLESNAKHEEPCLCMIPYNAWENDDHDPFESLIANIAKFFDEKKLSNKLGDGFKAFFQHADVFIKFLSPGLGKKVEELKLLYESTNYIHNHINKNQFELSDEMQAVTKRKALKESFKTSLSKLGGENMIKIIIIDELDRCRPDYAVNFLEVIKHFFNVPNVVFLIACDQCILGQTVKKVYGITDGVAYLSRFFNFTVMLPKSNNPREIILQKMKDKNAYSCCMKLLEALGIKNPRQIVKIANTLDLLLPYKSYNSHSTGTMHIVLLVALKITDFDSFTQLMKLNLSVHQGKIGFIAQESIVSGILKQVILLFSLPQVFSYIYDGKPLQDDYLASCIFLLFCSLCGCTVGNCESGFELLQTSGMETPNLLKTTYFREQFNSLKNKQFFLEAEEINYILAAVQSLIVK
jgi:hypothetical protein